LALYTRLDGAVHVEFFDFDVEHVGDAVQALRGIEDFQQLLFFLDGELQVGGNDVGEFGRIFHAHCRNHGLVIQRLAEFHILLKQGGDALHAGFDLRVHLNGIASDANRGLHVTVRIGGLQKAAALDALDEDFDIAVGQLQALHDVDDGADLIDFIRFGLVDGGIVLGGQEDLFVRGKSFFQGAHAGLAANHEGRHHVRKDDHVPNRHHGQLLGFEFFLGCGHSISLGQ